MVICPDAVRPRVAETVPLTPGRDVGIESLWSSWMEARLTSSDDRRSRLETKSDVGVLTFGLDRRFGTNFVVGFLASLELGNAVGIHKVFRSDSTGFSFGPYVAVRLTPNWAVDASITYGEARTEQDLASLNGTYTSKTWSGNVTVHGQYAIADVALRPKLSVNYTHVRNNAFRMEGLLLGRPLNVRVPSSSYRFGTIEASGEVSRTFTLRDGTRIMPYAELGAHYEFERPYSGRSPGGFSSEIPAAWTFSIRSGVRMAFGESLLLELSGGYLSLGQSKLDVWEGRFRVSLAF